MNSRKIQYVLLSFFFLPFLTIGQVNFSNTEITLGQAYRGVDNVAEYFTINQDTTIILSAKLDEDRLLIQTFSVSDLKELNRFEKDGFSKKIKPQGFLRKANQIFFLYSEYRQGVSSLLAREINLIDLKLLDEVEIIKVSGKLQSDLGLPPFKLSTFKDYNGLLVSYILKDGKEQSFCVTDSLLNVINCREVSMQSVGYQLTSEGNFSIVTRSKINQYRFVEYVDDKEVMKYIPTEGVYLDEVLLMQGIDKSTVGIGFYSDSDRTEESGLSAQGVFLININQTADVAETRKINFPEKLIQNVVSKSDSIESIKQGVKMGIHNLHVKSTYIEGEIITIIGEVNYQRNERDWGGWSDFNHAEDIIILKVNLEGNVIWSTNINKHQRSSYSDVHSINNDGFRYYFQNNKHYLLFFDHIDNARITDFEDRVAIHRGGAGGFLTVYLVDDNTGVKQHHVLFDARNVNGKPVYHFHIPNVLFLPGPTFITEVYLKNDFDALLRVKLDF